MEILVNNFLFYLLIEIEIAFFVGIFEWYKGADAYRTRMCDGTDGILGINFFQQT